VGLDAADATAVIGLDGVALHRALETAERWLALNRERINALNVYPVPDGDTGTNMLLTLRAALREAQPPARDVATVTAALARGALLGARGNSGVILSQIVRGMAERLAATEVLDGPSLASALRGGADAAYEAVTQPVEGTMLTVAREAADAAERAAEQRLPLAEVLRAAALEAAASVERTPALLDRLREAGVVDSGGLGVAVILEGLRCGVTGEPLPAAPAPLDGAVALDGVEHEGHGYCTEFVVLDPTADRVALLHGLEELGADSVLVVGDRSALRVHVHVVDPGPALSLGARLGALDAVKVDNMQRQHEAWRGAHEEHGTGSLAPGTPLPARAMVAVARGRGIIETFRALGAQVLVGGPGANPSAGDFLAAARGAASGHVFVLPNDKNAVMAAAQAAAEAPDLVTVVPTHSIAQGLAAAIAYVEEGEPPHVAERMTEAARRTRSIEVTRSSRDTSVDGIAVRRDDAIALLDGRLVAHGDALEDVLIEALRDASDEAELVTVYAGEDATTPPSALRARLEGAFPDLELEIVDGGQPLYAYLASVE
jgi:DAK2 domain fusion protein YloV